MNQEQYNMIQSLLIAQWKILQGIDIKAFLEAIERAQAVGPIVDPTLYRNGADNLRIIKDLAQKMLASKQVDCMALLPAALAHQAKQQAENKDDV